MHKIKLNCHGHIDQFIVKYWGISVWYNRQDREEACVTKYNKGREEERENREG